MSIPGPGTPDVPNANSAQPALSMTLRGARTHNLKRVDLDLPLRRLIVITGPSGAGKSSLAFDTLYAEGQRRYVETFSPDTRQVLAKLDKPAVDSLVGVPAAIAIGRPRGLPSSRSTVGTISEVHDSLALLLSRVGQVNCRNCAQIVAPATAASVSRAIEGYPAGTRYEVVFDVELRPETDQVALLRSLRAAGFTRLRSLGQVFMLDDQALPQRTGSSVEVIVDRLVRGSDPAERRTDSIETAFVNGFGKCRIVAGDESQTYVQGWRCGRCGTEHVEPQPNLFRYKSALGACPMCEGLGQIVELDLSDVATDPDKAIREGAQPAESVAGRTVSQHNRRFLNRNRSHRLCDGCQGARLRPEALAVTTLGKNIAKLSAITVAELRSVLEHADALRRDQATAGVVSHIESRLRCLGDIGLDYLTLDRPARSLSRGELQRVTLTKTLASGLVNTLYVIDEPTAGLHTQETARLISVLHRLRDQGNTLVVVEHDHDIMRESDHVVDLGPGAGSAGGQVLYNGHPSGFSSIEASATVDYLSGRKLVPHPVARRAKTRGELRLIGARGNNLKSIDVTFPLGMLCAVTGVSGSGKSTLIEQTLYPALRGQIAGEVLSSEAYDELRVDGTITSVVFLDQSPLARSARSNPATHLKAFDEIRRTFAATHEAKLRNYDAGRFSFNVEGGRCNHCQGTGFLMIDMQFLPDAMIRCPECSGSRYRPEILEVTYRGRNIAEVLELTSREAFGFFRHRPAVQHRLRPLLDLGLDYLRLGQPVSTLSGGESQRVKLAGFLGRSLAALNRPGAADHVVFLLDEPSAGLHPLDVVKLLDALHALVDRGHSVIVIEHSSDVIMNADWIIELGPGAGAGGGRVISEGTPEDIARHTTPTGEVLARTMRPGAREP
jgi:excinuclease ABC subunit A